MGSSKNYRQGRVPTWIWRAAVRRKFRLARNAPVGSRFDDFLREEGLFEEVSAIALKRVIAWQLAEAMKTQGITKQRMAAKMQTSRSQLDRLLDAQGAGMTLETLSRAIDVLGLRIRLEPQAAKQ